MLDFLKKMLDPQGPFGSFVSPFGAHKEHLGLPIAAPQSVRAAAVTSDLGALQKALAAPRFVAAGEEAPPAERRRQITQYLEERWAPVYAQPSKDDFAALARAASAPLLLGWRVSQHIRMLQCDCEGAKFTIREGKLLHEQCGRRAPWVGREHADDIAEHVQSLQVAKMADDSYNGVYPTLGGQNEADPRGHITRGRAEWRNRTKDAILWDNGTQAHLDRIQAEKARAKKAREALALEQYDKRHLPRKLGEV